MKITIATVGSRGDVLPYVALGRGLQSAGHQVQIATDPMVQGFIEVAGLGYSGPPHSTAGRHSADRQQPSAASYCVETIWKFLDLNSLSGFFFWTNRDPLFVTAVRAAW